jgi:DNA-binding response OmpR family regulator
MARSLRPSVLIADPFSPGLNGFVSILQIRDALPPQVPLIVLTAIRDDNYRAAALRLGADDFIGKPSSPADLTARITLRESPHRKSVMMVGSVLIGSCHFHRTRRTVTRHGTEICLSKREHQVLDALVSADGAVVERRYLLENVWKFKGYPNTRCLDFQIFPCGRKLKKFHITRSTS